jgi:hypothetical protein
MEPFSAEQLMGCMEMALSCMEKERHKRPCIRDIVDKLNMMDARDQELSHEVYGH